MLQVLTQVGHLRWTQLRWPGALDLSKMARGKAYVQSGAPSMRLAVFQSPICLVQCPSPSHSDVFVNVAAPLTVTMPTSPLLQPKCSSSCATVGRHSPNLPSASCTSAITHSCGHSPFFWVRGHGAVVAPNEHVQVPTVAFCLLSAKGVNPTGRLFLRNSASLRNCRAGRRRCAARSWPKGSKIM